MDGAIYGFVKNLIVNVQSAGLDLFLNDFAYFFFLGRDVTTSTAIVATILVVTATG